MKKNLLIIRGIFLLACFLGSFVIWYNKPFSIDRTALIFGTGIIFGFGIILLDIFLRRFSLRNVISILFGLAIGAIVAYLISKIAISFLDGAPFHIKNLVRLCLFTGCLYLGAVMILRSKDDFNLLIPYIRFVPNNVETPLIVVDMSALTDGRIAPICQSRFITATLIIPKFVIDELYKIAESEDSQRQLKGRKGIEVLNKLKNMSYIDLRIQDIEVDEAQHIDSKLIFLAQNLKAKLLTTDYNLAKLGEFHGIEWLNISALTKALNPEVSVGQYFDVDLVKPGKEPHQGVGYLTDGSMVVVNEAVSYIGQAVAAEVISVLPSAGGKMIFARLHSKPAEITV